jgi:hypothetical protein
MRNQIGGIQIAEPAVLFGRLSKVNKCPHKNVLVLSGSERFKRSCWSRKLIFLAGSQWYGRNRIV